MEKVMLSFDKVSAHYGKIQALHEVSLHINQGEIVTLIGANGAGKTTLLGTLCGYTSILLETPRFIPSHTTVRTPVWLVSRWKRTWRWAVFLLNATSSRSA